MISKSYSC